MDDPLGPVVGLAITLTGVLLVAAGVAWLLANTWPFLLAGGLIWLTVWAWLRVTAEQRERNRRFRERRHDLAQRLDEATYGAALAHQRLRNLEEQHHRRIDNLF